MTVVVPRISTALANWRGTSIELSICRWASMNPGNAISPLASISARASV